MAYAFAGSVSAGVSPPSGAAPVAVVDGLLIVEPSLCKDVSVTSYHMPEASNAELLRLGLGLTVNTAAGGLTEFTVGTPPPPPVIRLVHVPVISDSDATRFCRAVVGSPEIPGIVFSVATQLARHFGYDGARHMADSGLAYGYSDDDPEDDD